MTTTTYPKRTARKPVGGFVFLTVQQLCLLWWAYRTRLIQLMDFRVWCAAQEMVARRCQLAPDQVPDYTPRELHGLVGGVGGEYLRASLRRLQTLGLLTWSSTRLTFATDPTDLRGVEDLSDFFTMHQAIVNNRRRVPVPRQALRLIAGGCRATVIATMLGHLLRCLYYREQRCLSGGWCKASWIAEVFRLDLRSVKAARKHLVALGWLQPVPTPQRLGNRWGTYTRINLTWTRATMEQAAQDDVRPLASASPPPPGFSTTASPPPFKENKEPLQETQHQQPALHADMAPALSPHPPIPPGFGGPLPGVKKHATDHTKQATTIPPTLRHIVPDDLQDTARLLALFEQAQMQGLMGNSESERLTFLGLAEHARVVGSRNPCGLFAALLHRRCWHFVTDSDEAAAYQRFKAYRDGSDPPARSTPPPHDLAPPELSKDASIVRYLQTQLARAGFHGEVFGLVHQEDPTWTRARWDHAVGELAHAQQAWQQARALSRCGALAGGEGVLEAWESADADVAVLE